mgnify:CR=1 FL=1
MMLSTPHRIRPVALRQCGASNGMDQAPSFQASNPRRLILRSGILMVLAGTLAGCAPAALTAFGVGASTGVQHTLNGITYRTFTSPEMKVKGAALLALNRMGIKSTPLAKGEPGNVIRAKANDRDIELGFEALSSNSTRMRATAKQGLFYDSATAYEIIIQTERALNNT